MITSRHWLALIVIFLAGCSASTSRPMADRSSEPVLTFIHLNDTYRVDAVEEGRRGGFGRVTSIVRELLASGRDVRILHGGDFLYPSLESQLWDGEQMVEAMNFLDDIAPLYAVPGNHEFDPRTPDEVIRRIRESRFDWLGDNLDLVTGESDVDNRLRQAFTFASGGRKIGVFALTVLPDDGGNDRSYTPFHDGSYLEQAERAIAALERQNVELIVGLTHLHLGDDLDIAVLKARHPRFLFIAGGHEHEPEYQAGTAASASVMKGASNARTIWQVDVRFTESGPEIDETRIIVDESIPLARDYQLIADKWRARLLDLMPFLTSRIGDAALPLDGREVAVRSSDTNWGVFIADQMKVAFGEPPADFAFVNGGTLRIDDYIAEDITFEDIGRTFGFSSLLRYMTINGGDFRQLMEAGYRGVGPGKGYFPQISGFRVCVDRRRPDGDRIVQLQIPGEDGRWSEIDADKAYSLVAPDYLYGGGDGYDFSNARDVSRPGSELKYLVLDAVIEAQASGEQVGKPIDAGEHRFQILAAGAGRCFD